MSATFKMRVEEGDDLHVVHLYGELDMAEAPRVRDVLVSIGRSTVSVDLTNLSFLDARGLEAIMSARRTILADGNAFRIVGATGAVRRVFDLTGLASVLEQ